MALRTPSPFLLRKASAGRGILLPRRVKPKTSAFPLLPAAAATLLLLGCAQTLLWWWDSRLPDVPNTVKQSNPFVALPQALAKLGETPAAPVATVNDIQRLRVLPLPQNLQFGDAMGIVTVTIFTDPSCGACRATVQALTSTIPPKGVRLVYKFWPQDPQRLTPGLLVELARRNGVVGTLWRSMQGAGTKDLSDADLLGMVDAAGVALGDQRKALTEQGADLAMALEADIATAKNANLPAPPVFVVDDYVLDGQTLNPRFLNAYVQKRLAGRQILERDDLFLMNK